MICCHMNCFLRYTSTFTKNNIDVILNTNNTMIDNALKIAFANDEGEGEDERVVAAGPVAGELNRDQLLPRAEALDTKINYTSQIAIAILLKLLVDLKGNTTVPIMW